MKRVTFAEAMARGDARNLITEGRSRASWLYVEASKLTNDSTTVNVDGLHDLVTGDARTLNLLCDSLDAVLTELERLRALTPEGGR